MKPQIVKTKAGKFRVKYVAANGELLAHSEVLNSRQSANKNIKAMGKVEPDGISVLRNLGLLSEDCTKFIIRKGSKEFDLVEIINNL